MTITLDNSVTMADLTRMIRTHAHRIAKAFSIRCASYRDDLKQEAWLRVLRQLPLANVKILNTAIRRCLIDFLRRDKQLRNPNRIVTENVLLSHDAPTSHTAFQLVDDRDSLDAFLPRMSDRQQAIVRGLLAGKTQGEIANDIGITQPGVSQHFKQILADAKAWGAVA